MARRYQKADENVQFELTVVVDLHHKVLRVCGVTVAVVMVGDVDDETGEVGHCLQCAGYPAAATIRITPVHQRVLGMADAIMTIDEAVWDELDEQERMALLDHELCHLQVRGERGVLSIDGDDKLSGSVKTDDAKRPVLKLRKHDWQLGGFFEVARRHGLAAVEVRDMHRHRDASGQYYWDFGGGFAETAVDCAAREFVDSMQKTANKTGATVSFGTKGNMTTVATPQVED